MNITRPTWPTTVRAWAHSYDAWIVGSAADWNQLTPKDVDVMIPRDLWTKAAHLIPKDAVPNSFGGWKFTQEGVSVDVWPDTLDSLATSDFFRMAYHPRTGTRIAKVLGEVS